MSKTTKTLDAYIITLINDAKSTTMARVLLQSIEDRHCFVNPYIMPATTPKYIEQHIGDMKEDDAGFELGSFKKKLLDPKFFPNNPNWDAKYTWPITEDQNRLDLATGLQMNAYRAKNYRKVAACAVSHFRAWVQCCKNNRPIVVLESDAQFIDQFKIGDITSSTDDDKTWGVIGLNTPQPGQTRRAAEYQAGMAQLAKENPGKMLTPVPTVNRIGEPPVPQGLAGNSAYVIKPWAARELISKTLEVGLWPNDALMCKELFPWIRQLRKTVTQVQLGSPSTTTG